MRVFTLLLLLCVSVPVSAQSKDAQKPIPPVTGKAETGDKKDNPPAPKQEITVNLPSSVNLNLGGKLDIKSQNEQTHAYEEPSKWLDPVTWFTLILAGANIALWLSTRKAANAAAKNAEIAERSLLELESARIQVNLPSTQGALMWGMHAGPDVTYNLTNHGRSPAHILDVRVKMLVVVGDQWPGRGTGEDFKRHDTTRNLLPGGSTEGFYESLGRELESAEQRGLGEDSGHRIYFLGRIQYNDVFRRRHTRWFCYKRFPVRADPKAFTWAERGPENYNEETIEPALRGA